MPTFVAGNYVLRMYYSLELFATLERRGGDIDNIERNGINSFGSFNTS